jgi:hypothetical protein
MSLEREIRALKIAIQPRRIVAVGELQMTHLGGSLDDRRRHFCLAFTGSCIEISLHDVVFVFLFDRRKKEWYRKCENKLDRAAVLVVRRGLREPQADTLAMMLLDKGGHGETENDQAHPVNDVNATTGYNIVFHCDDDTHSKHKDQLGIPGGIVCLCGSYK